MGEYRPERHGLLRAAAAVLLASLAVACGTGPPAPVIQHGRGSIDGTRIVVQRGQTVSGIAREFGVPQNVIIAANRLTPPYHILTGQSLLLPGAGETPARPAPPIGLASAGASTPPPSSDGPSSNGPSSDEPPIAPAPPIRLALAATPMSAAGLTTSPTATTPASVPLKPMPLTGSAAAPAPPASVAGRPPPDIIPLDQPAPAKSAAVAPSAASPSKTPPEPAATARSRKPAPEPSAAEQARAEPVAASPKLARGGLLWPVQGRVLAGFGATQGGGHNDGINIAAPRGAAVRAVDAGVVAYSGNELRGYGNLILLKHGNGFISAYAHCDELLVKRGDKVKRGQVIAKVGATGSVNEPQLHFELRRGKRAVDPRDFLAPAPSAGAANHERRG